MTRRTKIVCTLGPASDSDATIEALLLAGMDVARLNFSHGTQETHAATLVRLRAAAERLGRPLAILQDLQGPKIRTGALAGGKPVTLHDGQRFTITTRPDQRHSRGRLDHLCRVSAGREAGRSHPALGWRDRAARAGDQRAGYYHRGRSRWRLGRTPGHQPAGRGGQRARAHAEGPRRSRVWRAAGCGLHRAELRAQARGYRGGEAARRRADAQGRAADSRHRQAGEARGHRAAGRDIWRRRTA